MTVLAYIKETRNFNFSAHTHPPNTETDVLTPTGSDTSTSYANVLVKEATADARTKDNAIIEPKRPQPKC